MFLIVFAIKILYQLLFFIYAFGRKTSVYCCFQQCNPNQTLNITIVIINILINKHQRILKVHACLLFPSHKMLGIRVYTPILNQHHPFTMLPSWIFQHKLFCLLKVKVLHQVSKKMWLGRTTMLQNGMYILHSLTPHVCCFWLMKICFCNQELTGAKDVQPVLNEMKNNRLKVLAGIPGNVLMTIFYNLLQKTIFTQLQDYPVCSRQKLIRMVASLSPARLPTKVLILHMPIHQYNTVSKQGWEHRRIFTVMSGTVLFRIILNAVQLMTLKVLRHQLMLLMLKKVLNVRGQQDQHNRVDKEFTRQLEAACVM